MTPEISEKYTQAYLTGRLRSFEDRVFYQTDRGEWIARILRPTLRNKNSALVWLYRKRFGEFILPEFDSNNIYYSARGISATNALFNLLTKIEAELKNRDI